MKISRSTLLMTLLLLIIAFLVLYPLLMLLYGSFRSEAPGRPGYFTLQGYVKAFSNLANYKTFWVTFWLGVLRVILAMGIALFLAWIVTRTDTPWKRWLEVLIWLQFFLPLQPLNIAWILLAASKVGFINQFLINIIGLESSPINIYSYGGIIWVTVLHWAAILFILITPSFKGMDASLEESARMSGASGLVTFFRITFPILSPAIFGATFLGFVRIMESFETELFLGFREGIYVYTTRVFELTKFLPIDYPQAMALSTVFLILVFILIILQWRLLARKEFTTVSGRGFAVRVMPLSSWRYVTLAFLLFYFALSTLLPLLTLLLGSFMKIQGLFVPEPFTLRHYQEILGDKALWSTLKNTLIVAGLSATLGMILYSIISYIVVRTTFKGRKALDLLSWLPWGVPGLVLALGFLWAYVGGLPLPFTLYGTIWLMILVFLVRGLPLGVRIMNSSMIQLGKELEESARVLGASWLYTFRRILAPLISPAFMAAWMVIFILVIRDLVTVVMLYTPKSRLLSILMFDYWFGGQAEKATVIALITVFFILIFAFLARLLGARQELAAH